MMNVTPESTITHARVVQIVSSISNEASGVTPVVQGLCEELISNGHDIALATLDWAPIQAPPTYLNTFQLGLGPRKLGRSPQMKQWLDDQASTRKVDVIHSHGLWMMPNVYAGVIAKKYDLPLIVAPHDTLSAWSMQSGSKAKRPFWHLIQKRALSATTCFHATAESEYFDIRRVGFKMPIAIVPNAVDIPKLPKKKGGDYKTLLFLGRIHPQKGIDTLLAAWCLVQSRFPDWRLLIVGPDNGGYLAKMKALAAKLDLKRVQFSEPLYGVDKVQAYRDADLFVLSSNSENFAMTVAESLACATPAIVSKGAPWSGLVTHNAGWWVDIGVEPLVAGLEQAMACSTMELQEMGRRGRTWMEQEFSWPRIGMQMAETYQWILHGGTCPSWVKID